MKKQNYNNNQNNNGLEVLMVTPEGLAEMKQELEERLSKQQIIANEIDEARQLGDLRENEPYQNAMRNKEINDDRIDELKYMISIAQVVEKDNDGSAGIGSKVTIVNVKNKREKTITLVGKEAAQEADPREGKVSIDSPIGAAVMGKFKGETAEVELPIGLVTYKIKQVA